MIRIAKLVIDSALGKERTVLEQRLRKPDSWRKRGGNRVEHESVQ